MRKSPDNRKVPQAERPPRPSHERGTERAITRGDLTGLPIATVDAAADYIPFVDADDGELKRGLPPTSGGATDHGALSGLADDDHSQYALADGTRGTFEVAGAVGVHEALGNPHPQYEETANKAAANGYASLDAGTKIPIAQIPTGSSGTTVPFGNDSRLSDDRTAAGLRTASTVVAVSSATAPTSGQVLTATSTTAATWQTPSGGGDILFSDAPTTAPSLSTSYEVLASKSVTMATGTVVEIEVTGSILNNSGANRTYTWKATIGSFAIEGVDGAVTTPSATNVSTFRIRAVFGMRSTSSCRGYMEMFRNSPTSTTAPNQLGSGSASTFRQGTGISALDFTGSNTLKIEVKSDNSTATQTLTVHTYQIREQSQQI